LAGGSREGVLAELGRAGFSAEVQGERLLAQTPTLDAEGLRRLTRALGPEAAASVRIQQASMNDVFRRLVREGPAREAAAPGGAA